MADTPELDDEVKRFIVMALACFDSPSKVAASVKEEFELDLSRQRVHAYNPTKKAGSALSEELKALFTETRAQFLSETAQVPVASRVYRLRKLQAGIDAMERLNNHMGVAQLLKQAAEEVGDVYTNKRDLNHKGAIDIGVGELMKALDGSSRGLPKSG